MKTMGESAGLLLRKDGGLGMPGTGGVAAHARNDRGQLSMSLFF